MTSSSPPSRTGQTKEEQEHIDALIKKMIELKILKADRNVNEDNRIQFTQEFDRHLSHIDKRIDGDPETHSDSSDISEELKSILLNYLKDNTKKTELGEDELYDMGCDGLFIKNEKCRQGSDTGISRT
jgi:hypothetical protein